MINKLTSFSDSLLLLSQFFVVFDGLSSNCLAYIRRSHFDARRHSSLQSQCFMIYGTLLVAFIFLICQAFRNLFEEKIAQSSRNPPAWKLKMTMPSMTICSLENSIAAKNILDISIDSFPFNISAFYANHK